MKKNILSLTFVLFTLVSMAQKPEYVKTMEETLAQFSSIQNEADLQTIGNKFQVIANAEKEEWLPLYYHAHSYIIMSFMEQGDAAKKESLLDVAEGSINKMMELAPNESEAFALQAFYLTGRLVVNPMERGQEYSGLIQQALDKALAIDPANPRAQLLKIQMDMGSAPYMGLDPKSFCPQAKELLAKWDTFTPKSSIHPMWGKDQAEQVVNQCQ